MMILILYSKNEIWLREYRPVRLIDKFRIFYSKKLKLRKYDEKNNCFKRSVPDGRMCDDN